MSTPFLTLAPHSPRIVDIPYAAFALSCAPDVTDISDATDTSGDVTDMGDDEI
jgi:hypothetical protein